MIRIETALPGVLLLEPDLHADERGFFMETYRRSVFEEAGIRDEFVQDNHSRSLKGVLRGLHYQVRSPQAKLCRVTAGAVFDAVVDIRRGSRHFGWWVGAELSASNRRIMYIPPGFAHGFLVLSDAADFLYKCSAYREAGDEYGIAWDDPGIGIDWPLDGPPVLSSRDAALPRLRDIPGEFFPPCPAEAS